MMKTGLLSLLSLLTLTGAENQCSEGWHYFGGSCYGISEEALKWTEAQEVCEVFKSTLAEIETADEDAFIKNLQQTKQVSFLWLGGTDILNNGIWIWLSTKENIFPYSNWYPGDPDGKADQNCLIIAKTYNYKWLDANCTMSANFLCEVKTDQTVVG